MSDWTSTRLGDLLRPSNERSSRNDQFPVLTSSRSGLHLQSEYFNRVVASKDNTGYKVIRKGQFTYRAMSDDGFFRFNRLSEQEAGIISPAYEVFECETQKADPIFMDYLLNSGIVLSQIYGAAQGGTRLSLRLSTLSEFDAEIPPLPEQKKIAEILSGIDRSIQAEVNMASKITKQYQGVLSQIFDDVSKQIPLGDYLPLGDLGLDISDGNYSAKYPSASEFVERGVPFIRASNMKEGTIDDKDMRFISATKHQEITKGHLKSGDILIANRGEIGKTSRVPERHIGSNINAQVVRINGGIRIDSSFLFHYLSSPFCQKLIDELTTGTALKQLPIGNLVKLLIPVPEMSMQIATGGALDSMQRVINAINEKSRKRSQLKHALAIELLSGRKRVSV